MASDDVVEINEDDIDETSDGAIQLRVNDALAPLELSYAGIDNEGLLQLETTSDLTAELSGEELTQRIADALDTSGLRQRLGLRGYRVASSSS